MKKVLLIRHAESEENEGKFFEDSRSIKLSNLGLQQAEDLAEVLGEPKRIFVSKYLRAQQTSAPLVRKYPKSQTHVWLDLHEFEPHDNKKLHESLDRKSFFADYWNKNDPFLRPSKEKENFHEAWNRVINIVKKMSEIEDGINYIITHGMIIKLIIFLKANPSFYKDSILGKEDIGKIMVKFTEFNFAFKAKNIECFDLTDFLNDLSIH